jgi:transcriptional regulator with XRE-family HTH domain
VPRSPEDRIALIALGRAVRELRARRYVSQEGLGFDARMHRNRVGAIERGEANLGFVSLMRLLRALDVPMEEFGTVLERQHRALRRGPARSHPG